MIFISRSINYHSYSYIYIYIYIASKNGHDKCLELLVHNGAEYKPKLYVNYIHDNIFY